MKKKVLSVLMACVVTVMSVDLTAVAAQVTEMPEARGNVPSHGEPQTPAPSSEVALDLKMDGRVKPSRVPHCFHKRIRKTIIPLPSFSTDCGPPLRFHPRG